MTWAVYVNGRFMGYVEEKNEELARCAALYRFDILPEDTLEVIKEG